MLKLQLIVLLLMPLLQLLLLKLHVLLLIALDRLQLLLKGIVCCYRSSGLLRRKPRKHGTYVQEIDVQVV